MKHKKLLRFLIAPLVVFLASCASYENEKQVALDASERFYERFVNDKNLDDLQKETEFLNPGRGQDKLLEKLKLIREALGTVNDRKLRKTEVSLNDAKTPIVWCNYVLSTNDGAFHQQVIWHVKDQKALLAEVFTFTYNSKGEQSLLVSDGKIIY
jgi:hypothetical protein